MTIWSYNQKSLKKHSLTRWELADALRDPLLVEVNQSDSDSGNPRSMCVCMLNTATLLEIGIEFMEGDHNHVYHANSARSHYRKLYQNTRR